MTDPQTFLVFLTAALGLAVMPGPGMVYVLARTLRGGRREGIFSALGTSIAGLLHTLAAALGISVILTTSALAFSVVKWLGVIYLIYLGVRTLVSDGIVEPSSADTLSPSPVSRGMAAQQALRQGIITEVLNPKTALFFLAFIPQFINPDGYVFWQFMLLGTITTIFTSGMDIVVITLATPLSKRLQQRGGLARAGRIGSGTALIGLGVYVAIDR
ncbi:MAG: LysE family translocator [Deinococcota bacterium]